MVCMPHGVRDGRQGACEARREARQGACEARQGDRACDARGERREAVSCKSRGERQSVARAEARGRQLQEQRREAGSCKSTQATAHRLTAYSPRAHSLQPLTCDSRLLALGVAGTCLYAIQSGEHVSKLRNDITSPGGTTGLCLFLKMTLICVAGFLHVCHLHVCHAMSVALSFQCLVACASR